VFLSAFVEGENAYLSPSLFEILILNFISDRRGNFQILGHNRFCRQKSSKFLKNVFCKLSSNSFIHTKKQQDFSTIKLIV
jgi:hypothetical protein